MEETITRKEMLFICAREGITVSNRTIDRYSLTWVNKPDIPKLFNRAEALEQLARTIEYKRKIIRARQAKLARRRRRREKHELLEVASA